MYLRAFNLLVPLKLGQYWAYVKTDLRTRRIDFASIKYFMMHQNEKVKRRIHKIFRSQLITDKSASKGYILCLLKTIHVCLTDIQVAQFWIPFERCSLFICPVRPFECMREVINYPPKSQTEHLHQETEVLNVCVYSQREGLSDTLNSLFIYLHSVLKVWLEPDKKTSEQIVAHMIILARQLLRVRNRPFVYSLHKSA